MSVSIPRRIDLKD
ncbi:unnamed protein product, partial [Didymodactylos carnosus]